MFDRKSALVRMWVDQLLDGRRKPSEVPSLSNLKNVVMEMYDEEKNELEDE